MEKMDICFFEKSFIDRSFLVLKILNSGTLCSPPFPLWIHKSSRKIRFSCIGIKKLQLHGVRSIIQEVRRYIQGVHSNYIQEVNSIMQEVHGKIQEVPGIVQEVRSYVQEANRIMQEVRRYIKKCAVLFEKCAELLKKSSVIFKKCAFSIMEKPIDAYCPKLT